MPELDSALRLRIDVAEPYEVLVGPDLIRHLPRLIPNPQLAIICDENVAEAYGASLPEMFSHDSRQVELLVVEPGETSKSIARWSSLLEHLASSAYSRDCAVVGLGGGIITDLAGFVAASYLRGVDFYSVPTSLLGMVDAGVGGKTGLNLQAGKNLVGAFWQPRKVVVDVNCLSTLPQRQFQLGAVEFFKHALIGLPRQLELLGTSAFRRDADPQQLSEWLADNIGVKARTVAADEREGGVRAHLNYGHTLGHALEGASGHRLAHGEAVAYGILFATLLGRSRAMRDVTPLAMQLLRYVQPEPLGAVALPELLPFMARDKKNRMGVQRFVLLEEPGKPVIVDDITPAEIESAWLELRRLVEGLDWEASN